MPLPPLEKVEKVEKVESADGIRLKNTENLCIDIGGRKTEMNPGKWALAVPQPRWQSRSETESWGLVLLGS